TARWVDAKRRALWLTPGDGPSLFVSNWGRSMLDQLCDGVTSPIEELLVMAPFYDEKAKALEVLIERLKPKVITVHECRGMSVDGSHLVNVLVASAARISVIRCDEFVHAKLLGLVAGGRGRLLSGSANLSRSAMMAAIT